MWILRAYAPPQRHPRKLERKPHAEDWDRFDTIAPFVKKVVVRQADVPTAGRIRTLVNSRPRLNNCFLPCLEELVVQSHKLDDAIRTFHFAPATLSRILIQLSPPHNDTTQEDLINSIPARFPSLEVLKLHLLRQRPEVEVALASVFRQLQTLRAVELTGHLISKTTAASLSTLPQLHTLRIVFGRMQRSTKVDFRWTATPGSFCQLRNLMLDCNFDDSVSILLRDIPSLDTLKLCSFGRPADISSVCESISRHHGLRSVILWHMQVNDFQGHELQPLGMCASLEVLNVGLRIPGSDDKCYDFVVEDLTRRLPNLQEIGFRVDRGYLGVALTLQALFISLQHCPLLKHAEIHMDARSSSVPQIIAPLGHRNLRTLGVQACGGISGRDSDTDSPEQVAWFLKNHLIHPEELRIMHCGGIDPWHDVQRLLSG